VVLGFFPGCLSVKVLVLQSATGQVCGGGGDCGGDNDDSQWFSLKRDQNRVLSRSLYASTRLPNTYINYHQPRSQPTLTVRRIIQHRSTMGDNPCTVGALMTAFTSTEPPAKACPNPVLQVLQVKPLAPQPNGTERYALQNHLAYYGRSLIV
jgi:hypothetical protein